MKSLRKAGIVLSAIGMFLLAGCSNNIEDVDSGKVVLDNDYVTVRVYESSSRTITQTVSYTKDDWAYSTTTVGFNGSSEESALYEANGSVVIECKDTGDYTFASTAYASDKTTVIATSNSVTKSVDSTTGDFSMNSYLSNIGTYEVVVGVEGTITPVWGAEPAIESTLCGKKTDSLETVKTTVGEAYAEKVYDIINAKSTNYIKVSEDSYASDLTTNYIVYDNCVIVFGCTHQATVTKISDGLLYCTLKCIDNSTSTYEDFPLILNLSDLSFSIDSTDSKYYFNESTVKPGADGVWDTNRIYASSTTIKNSSSGNTYTATEEAFYPRVKIDDVEYAAGFYLTKVSLNQ